MSGQSRLLGRVASGVYLQNRDVLAWTIATEDGVEQFTWTVEGDCCSHSEFRHIALSDVNGKRITKVEELAPTDRRIGATKRLWSRQGDDDGECLQVYGVLLTAEDGSEGLVIHTNLSNGYYGGWLVEDGTAWLSLPTREAEV